MTGTSRSNGHVTATPGDHQAAEQGDPRRFTTLKRAAMAGVTAFIAVNIWTGAPLLALWVGSQVVGQRALSMAAVGVVVVVLAVLVFARGPRGGRLLRRATRRSLGPPLYC
jgi:hypothetical protein